MKTITIKHLAQLEVEAREGVSRRNRHHQSRQPHPERQEEAVAQQPMKVTGLAVGLSSTWA
jgi:hypothetical protein